MKPFERVWALVRNIPKGKVATYGQLSRMIDRRLTPVGIGWAMRAAPAGVPWHRVINSQGGVSTDKETPGRQRALLQKEGVRFTKDGLVDLKKYGWKAALLFVFLFAATAHAEHPVVATYSIVARDPATGELGIAVQSRAFAVGSIVPWAKAGVGAIATQALANPTYGPRGLEALERGKSAAETLKLLLASDSNASDRQVGILSASGESANHTGKDCVAWAGAKTGANYTAQGNILVSEKVIDELARAFERAEGSLPDRLLAALDAAQAAGGDSRGMQSAALLVVQKDAGFGGLSDRLCDIRVDDAKDPLKELRRIYLVWKPNNLVRQGYQAVDAKDFARAIRFGKEAVALDPKLAEAHYHLACFYAQAGQKEDAIKELETTIKLEPKNKARAAKDPDFKSLSADPKFNALVPTSAR